MSDERAAELSIQERLSARFPVEAHKKVNKGGGDQTYVPAVDIFDRVDDVLGMTGWQARVIREGMTATEAWVLGEITAKIDGIVVVRQQYGCEAITVGRDAKPVGDLFKKAATDAYKKCLTLMGVARYLYDADERREVEAEMREASRPKPKPPVGTPVDLDAVRNAAVLTGANPQASAPKQTEAPPEDAMVCASCQKHVPTDAELDIQRDESGARRKIGVAKFAPVCIERLGAFHCGPCYDRKHWKKGA